MGKKGRKERRGRRECMDRTGVLPRRLACIKVVDTVQSESSRPFRVRRGM